MVYCILINTNLECTLALFIFFAHVCLPEKWIKQSTNVDKHLYITPWDENLLEIDVGQKRAVCCFKNNNRSKQQETRFHAERLWCVVVWYYFFLKACVRQTVGCRLPWGNCNNSCQLERWEAWRLFCVYNISILKDGVCALLKISFSYISGPRKFHKIVWYKQSCKKPQ